MLSEIELMEEHVNVLYKHDETGKITTINEPPYEIAPRLYIGTTKNGCVVRYSNLINESIKFELNKVINSNSHIELADLITILSRNDQIKSIWLGPTYVFPEMKKELLTRAIKITASNKELLKAHFPYTYEEFEFKQPCYAIVRNDRVVSICCSARQTSKAAEASLYTLEEFRGQGFGVEICTAWAKDVQKHGRIALFSTSWDNVSSQTVAKKLNLVQYGTEINIR